MTNVRRIDKRRMRQAVERRSGLLFEMRQDCTPMVICCLWRASRGTHMRDMCDHCELESWTVYRAKYDARIPGQAQSTRCCEIAMAAHVPVPPVIGQGLLRA